MIPVLVEGALATERVARVACGASHTLVCTAVERDDRPAAAPGALELAEQEEAEEQAQERVLDTLVARASAFASAAAAPAGASRAGGGGGGAAGMSRAEQALVAAVAAGGGPTAVADQLMRSRGGGPRGRSRVRDVVVGWWRWRREQTALCRF